jgi:nucleolysin TIA-1/TIAR
VENLSPRVTEYMLTEIFAVAGSIQDVKIITPDRRIDENGGLINNYGFVEYVDMRAAETAVQVLNGRKIFDTEIRVNRAYQQNKEDTSSHFRVFVGDLGSEVDDNVLGSLFSGFGISEASVMWDMNGKSRGYGFVAFPHKTDAEQAIAIMNGHQLGSRAISVTWANQRTQGGPSESTGSRGGTAPAPQAVNFLGTSSPLTPLSYETIVRQTPAYNTTVCVGNLVPHCTQTDLISLFQPIGNFSEIRMQVDRGFASVKVESHEHAAMAIVELHGHMVYGRPIMCSWGKERPDTGTLPTGPLSPTQSAAAPHTNMVRCERSPI